VGDVLARNLGIKKGDHVTLRGTVFSGDWTFNVVAVYHADPSAVGVDRTWFLFKLDYLNESLPEARRDQVEYIVSRISDGTRSAEVSRAIDAKFATEEVPTITMTEKQGLRSLVGFFSSVLQALEVMSVGVVVITLLLLGNMMAMAVRERTSEYAVLRALGFSPGRVIVLVVSETLMLAVGAGLFGLAAAHLAITLALGRIVEDQMGHLFLRFEITAGTAVLTVGGAFAVGLLAASLSATRVAWMPLRAALRKVD
jgi:putative ABC transport system permease protein